MRYRCYDVDLELDLMVRFRMHRLQQGLDQIFHHPIAVGQKQKI